jgi:hypothetical protein
MLQSLENAYSQVYSKVFHSFDRVVIKQCQFCCGQTPVELKVANRRINFLKRLNLTDNIYCKYFDVEQNELITLVSRFCFMNDRNVTNLNASDIARLHAVNYRPILRKYFENSINMIV